MADETTEPSESPSEPSNEPPALAVDVPALTGVLDGHYAEVRRAVRDLQARQYLRDRLVPAYERETQHPTEASHLLFSNSVAGVIFKTTPVYFVNCGVSTQEVGYFFTVLAMSLHSYMKSFQST